MMGTMTFGPAMNEAYGIEQQWAVYPAVILSNEAAAKAAEFRSQCVCVDPHRPHLLMLDYLEPFRTFVPESDRRKVSCEDSAKLIVSHIQGRLSQHQSNQSLHSKAKWLGVYWDSAVSDLGVLPTTKDTIENRPLHGMHEATRLVSLQGQKVVVSIKGHNFDAN